MEEKGIIEQLKGKIEEVITNYPECKVEIIVHRQSWLFLQLALLLLCVMAGVFLGMLLALEVFRSVI